MDPIEKLDETFNELQKLWEVYSNSPIFGINFSFETEAPVIDQLFQPRVEDDVEILDEEEDTHAVVAAYYAESGDTLPNSLTTNTYENITFDTRLGLAIESMQEGVTIDSLWRVV